MHLSLPKQFPLFILASSVCMSLQCLISALTQGAKVVTHLGSLVQLCCEEGGTLQTNVTGECGVCAQCLGHTGSAPAPDVCFPSLHCSGSRLLCRELSETGPGMRALPRSEPLRFRFSGTPQRRRLGWASFCALTGPSCSGPQVLDACSLPRWGVCPITSPVPAARFPAWQRVRLPQVCPVSPLGS